MLAELNPEARTADGFDEALVGIAELFSAEGRVHLAAYDTGKVIEILMRGDEADEGMDYESAVEHFNFNIAGAYVGPGTPVFIDLS